MRCWLPRPLADGDPTKRLLFVGATAGTTVLGAFDPFDEIATICAKQMWLHVDGAWGGGASEKLRQLVAGVEKADSFCWNPHKPAPLFRQPFS